VHGQAAVKEVAAAPTGVGKHHWGGGGCVDLSGWLDGGGHGVVWISPPQVTYLRWARPQMKENLSFVGSTIANGS
jgi:hypothetical protein